MTGLRRELPAAQRVPNRLISRSLVSNIIVCIVRELRRVRLIEHDAAGRLMRNTVQQAASHPDGSNPARPAASTRTGP
jgi:hypothetical protein